MSEKLMTIQEVTKMFGITARTLRFYEDKDLLSPTREGQKRLYAKRDIARLKLILRGKRFGFSLNEIKPLLDLYKKDGANYEQISKAYEVAKQRLEDLKDQRDGLNEAIRDLEEQLEWGKRVISQVKGSPQNNTKAYG